METGSARRGEIERGEGRKGRVRTKKTMWGPALHRDTVEPGHPTLLARRIARLPRRIPAPTVLLRAKWLIIIIIILYFLRSPETTEKQKARGININKSSGHRTYRRTGRETSEDGKSGTEEGAKPAGQQRMGGREDTQIGKEGERPKLLAGSSPG